MLTPATLPALQRAIADAGLDGWLLFDFQGLNPIAGGLLRLEGMVTRRIFVWIPRDGVPSALGHAIEQVAWRTWPREWRHATYSSWRTLETALAAMVRGKRIAMEYSPGDAVPYLDRVPAGVLEMVRAAGPACSRTMVRTSRPGRTRRIRTTSRRPSGHVRFSKARCC
jgi:Xaa-Pro dipeptidase